MDAFDALNQAAVIIWSKRVGGYANHLEQFAGDTAEMALSKLESVDDYLSLPGNIRNLICDILFNARETQALGALQALEFHRR